MWRVMRLVLIRTIKKAGQMARVNEDYLKPIIMGLHES